uniref:Putative secreted protein n=1 Tax=Anopheles triannulatus TaxID=58253 RepID=A0A2M4B1W8_9DIPT
MCVWMCVFLSTLRATPCTPIIHQSNTNNLMPEQNAARENNREKAKVGLKREQNINDRQQTSSIVVYACACARMTAAL